MIRVFILRLSAIATTMLSSIASQKASAAESVEQWGIYELTLTGPRNGNPFVDVEVGATFTKDQLAIKVSGFYDGDGIYRIRFMPESTGTWSYRTTSNRVELAGKSGELEVAPPSPPNHFAYADGTPFRPIGTTCYGWTGREAPKEWTFDLYKSGLRDGMQFQVEIIDTWDMMVTAVPGTFVTKRKDAYHFADEQHRAVELPGKPGILLRIRRIGDTSGDPVIEEPNE
jgi:hypothetical protein